MAVSGIDVGRVVRFLHDAPYGGDTTYVDELSNGLFLAIVDVLGHGTSADTVRLDIETFLRENAEADLTQVMTDLDQFLRGSIGAAAGLCHIDRVSGKVDYTGIGNTAARRFGGADTRLVSRDGVLGQTSPTPKIESLRMEPDDILVLYTDGIKTHFEVDEYPQILSDDAQTVADTVLRQFGKPHDDAACIVAKFHR
jgi:hypothetical protein